MERLVQHLHDFARETRLSTEEWMAGIEFLTAVGKISSDVRQEFVLLSDTLGLSLLVDNISHPKPAHSTQGTVLGPFHTHDATHQSLGASISHDTAGEPLLVVCSIRDTNGAPLSDVSIDVWETDSKGAYDVQYPDRSVPDGRAVLKSDDNGTFWFNAIVPVPYPIPDDGPVGKMLARLRRHCWRPSHMHFLFEKEGFDKLVTALYIKGSPYETSDAVFGVKESLIVELEAVMEVMAREYGVAEGTKLLRYNFVLVTERETRELRDREARRAVEMLGRRDVVVVDGVVMPVCDVD
jgi:protocatechuate 3,4-dioxygenase beta subunit